MIYPCTSFFFANWYLWFMWFCKLIFNQNNYNPLPLAATSLHFTDEVFTGTKVGQPEITAIANHNHPINSFPSHLSTCFTRIYITIEKKRLPFHADFNDIILQKVTFLVEKNNNSAHMVLALDLMNSGIYLFIYFFCGINWIVVMLN